MDLKAVERVVAKIQTQLFKNSNAFSVGMLKSHFRGSGLVFKEHQIYNHGDDVRFIDWKLLAKSNVPYVKTFEEERNVEIIVVIDYSQSMFMGYKGISKLQVALEVCCLLYLLAKETNDTVHVILTGEEILRIPKKSGQEGIVNLIALLEKFNILNASGVVSVDYIPKKQQSKESKLGEIVQHLYRKKEIVLLSDFYNFLPEKGFENLFKRNNVHCFQIVSPLDDSTETPFSLFAYNSTDSHKKSGHFFNLKTQKKNSTSHMLLGRKHKKLFVGGRYLEDFVKEML